MSVEIDPGSGPGTGPGTGSGTGSGSGRPRRRSGVAVAVIAAFLVVVLALAYALGRIAFPGVFGSTPDYTGPGEGVAQVHILRGDSAADIGATLKANDVVKSVGAFRNAARSDDRSRSVAPGWYQLRKRMKASLALALLLDPAARLRSTYVIPEGFTIAQTLQKIAKSVDGMSLADLTAAAANPAALGVPEYAPRRGHGALEGFLFPATYEVEPGTSAVDALAAMVDRFDQAATDVDLERGAAALHLTPYQVLTIASLVEGEARFAPDRGKVARVALNRLAKGMRLEFDSTIQYALGKPKVALSQSDLAIDSPYNSRKHTGLPPTPINNPGQAALEAALHPTPGTWLYFVVIDTAGHSGFATTYDEFLRLKRQGIAATRG